MQDYKVMQEEGTFAQETLVSPNVCGDIISG